MSRTRPSVDLLRVDELDAALLDRWRQRRSSDPTLAGPSFDPAFTLAVAAADPDGPVRVIVVEGETFWPVQFGAGGVAGPIGGRLNDQHGLIGRLPETTTAPAVLRNVGIRAYRFDHLLRSQSDLLAGSRRGADGESPFLDLGDGFDAYVSAVQARGSDLAAKLRRDRNRIIRDFGPLRFTAADAELPAPDAVAAWDALVRWKSAQYRATGVPDLFRPGWTARAIDELRRSDAAGCHGTLSTLHAGERLLAVHLGLRSQSEWQWWLPTYEPTIGSRHSPGLQLLTAMAEAAPASGIRRIDLGKGPERYKERTATGSVPMASGVIEPRSASVALRRARTLARRVTGRVARRA